MVYTGGKVLEKKIGGGRDRDDKKKNYGRRVKFELLGAKSTQKEGQ